MQVVLHAQDAAIVFINKPDRDKTVSFRWKNEKRIAHIPCTR